MKTKTIALIAVGSRGDVQPFLALAIGLQKAGFTPLLVVPSNEAAFVRSFGIPVHALSVDMQKILDNQAAQEMTKGDNPFAFAKSHLEGSKALKAEMLQTQHEIWSAVQNVDAIIYHPGMQNAVYMAQELGIPAIMASPFPFHATSNYPAILFYDKIRVNGAFGKILNQSTHALSERLFWMLGRGAAKEFWKVQGKPHIPQRTPPSLSVSALQMPKLFGYSPLLFPRDTAWSDNIAVTGYWTLPENQDFTPSTDLTHFLEHGNPPIYIGFGSMKDKSTFQKTLNIISQAVERVGERAVVGMGWSNVDEGIKLPESVMLIGSIPHEWLFPRMKAVVHHGGAGTTAAGLRAGKPTLVIPHLGDQPAWGLRVWELGTGTKPIPKKKLTVDTLTKGLEELIHPRLAENAALFQQKILAENGVKSAIQIVSGLLGSEYSRYTTNFVED